MSATSPTVAELAARLGVAADVLARDLTRRFQEAVALDTLTADPFRSEHLPELPERLYPYDRVPARLRAS